MGGRRAGKFLARPGNLVGNGPFVLRAWEPDRAIVLDKSPTYWDAARVRLREIRFYPIDSLNAEERAFRAGQLHLTDALPVDRWMPIAARIPRVCASIPIGNLFLPLQHHRPYLSDARSGALALAIDRRAIVDRVLRGGQAPATAFTPAGIGGYAPPPGPEGGLAEARHLLPSRIPGRQGLPPFELLYNKLRNAPPDRRSRPIDVAAGSGRGYPARQPGPKGGRGGAPERGLPDHALRLDRRLRRSHVVSRPMADRQRKQFHRMVQPRLR